AYKLIRDHPRLRQAKTKRGKLMKVLVAGARGGIGRLLVDKLVAQGHQVTGMVRSEEQRAQLERGGVRGILVDLTEADALIKVTGQDAVIFAAGSKGKAL